VTGLALTIKEVVAEPLLPMTLEGSTKVRTKNEDGTEKNPFSEIFLPPNPAASDDPRDETKEERQVTKVQNRDSSRILDKRARASAGQRRADDLNTSRSLCRACQRDLPAEAIVCPYCGTPTPGHEQGGQSGNPPGEKLGFIIATGRKRSAGFSISGGGIAVALSAFLPWITVIGFVDVHLSGISIAIIFVLGGLLAYLGVRVLRDLASRAILIGLWVLAGIDVLTVIGLFYALDKIGSSGEVAPGTGFYLALIGLIASIVGTVLLQLSTRRASAEVISSESQVGLLSEDGRWRWNGERWLETEKRSGGG
jgi:hypothetical protein